MNPQNTIFDIKRIIGRNYNEENVQSNINYWPFKVIEDNNRPLVQVKYKNKIEKYTAEEISSMILSEMKGIAEDYLGETISDVVITVPACFNDIQRKATIDAGKLAGLNVLDIIDESTAAALAYGFNNKIENIDNILVVDFGGGTYDVSLLSIYNGKYEVKAISGDTHLGGEDFNNRLIDYFIEEIKTKYGKNIKTDPKYPEMLTRLRLVCEDAKCKLSSIEKTDVEIINLYDEISLKSRITRIRFEELCKDLFDKLIKPIENVINYSKISKSDVNEIVLVGGSTRIPKVQEIISAYFDGRELKRKINKDEAVVYGAAIQASMLFKNKEKMEDFNKSNDMNSIIKKEEDPSNVNLDHMIENVNKCKKDREKENERIETMNNLERFIYETCNNLENNIIDKYFEIYIKSIEDIILYKKNFEKNKKIIEEEYYNIELNFRNKINLIYQMNGNSEEKSKSHNNGHFENTINIYNNQKSLSKYFNWIINNKCYCNQFYDTNLNLYNKNELNYQIISDDYNYKYNTCANNIYINYKNELIKCFNSCKDWIKNNPNASKEEYDNTKAELDSKMKIINQMIEEAKKFNEYCEKRDERIKNRKNLQEFIQKSINYLEENEDLIYNNYVNYVNKLIYDLETNSNSNLNTEKINQEEIDYRKIKQKLEITIPIYQMFKCGKEYNKNKSLTKIFNTICENYDIINKNENDKKDKYAIINESFNKLYKYMTNKNNKKNIKNI
eukprot:jgi/Orpsp1_1/1191083/evm.model.d7180000083359.2